MLLLYALYKADKDREKNKKWNIMKKIHKTKLRILK